MLTFIPILEHSWSRRPSCLLGAEQFMHTTEKDVFFLNALRMSFAPTPREGPFHVMFVRTHTYFENQDATNVPVSLHILDAVMDISLIIPLYLQNISLKNAREDPHTDVLCPSSCCQKQSLHCTCRLVSVPPSQMLNRLLHLYFWNHFGSRVDCLLGFQLGTLASVVFDLRVNCALVLSSRLWLIRMKLWTCLTYIHIILLRWRNCQDARCSMFKWNVTSSDTGSKCISPKMDNDEFWRIGHNFGICYICVAERLYKGPCLDHHTNVKSQYTCAIPSWEVKYMLMVYWVTIYVAFLFAGLEFCCFGMLCGEIDLEEAAVELVARVETRCYFVCSCGKTNVNDFLASWSFMTEQSKKKGRFDASHQTSCRYWGGCHTCDFAALPNYVCRAVTLYWRQSISRFWRCSVTSYCTLQQCATRFVERGSCQEHVDLFLCCGKSDCLAIADMKLDDWLSV